MSEEKIVMYDSPEAASRIDMPGWKSRLGHFYPGDNAAVSTVRAGLDART